MQKLRPCKDHKVAFGGYKVAELSGLEKNGYKFIKCGMCGWVIQRKEVEPKGLLLRWRIFWGTHCNACGGKLYFDQAKWDMGYRTSSTCPHCDRLAQLEAYIPGKHIPGDQK